MKPLISIIMPCFNTERYIKEALESLLAQNYDPIEIIVVDDGSTDNSAEIIRSFGNKVEYFYQPNGGSSKARNTGIARAKGEFIGFLDADDMMREGMLEKCTDIFANTPKR